MSFHKLLIASLLMVSASTAWADGVTTPAAGPLVSATMTNFYDYKTGFRFQDEFFSGNVTVGSVGNLGWSVGGGVATTAPLSEANHPGIIQRSTGSTAGQFAYLLLPFTQGNLLAGTLDMTFIVRLNTNDSDTTTRIGAMYLINTTPTDGLYFEKLAADTNWFYVTRAASTQTGSRTDTGIAVSTGWITMRIVRTDDTSVAFYLNGTLIGTQTANIPTAQGTSPGLQIVNAANAIKTIDIDYFEMIRTGMTR